MDCEIIVDNKGYGYVVFVIFKLNNNNYFGEYIGVIVVFIFFFDGIWCILII